MHPYQSVALNVDSLARLVASGACALPGTAKPSDILTVPKVEVTVNRKKQEGRVYRHGLAVKTLRFLREDKVRSIAQAATYMGVSTSMAYKAWMEFGPNDWTDRKQTVRPLE